MDSRCRQGGLHFEASPSRVLFQTALSAALRLRTNAAKRFEKVENATAVIWKMLRVAERKFRRLNAPELVKEVYLGVRFANGERRKEETREAVA